MNRMGAFERAKVGVAIVAAAVAFNTATLTAQDNSSDAAALNKIVENNKKIVEEAKKIEEARKKEAEHLKRAEEAAKMEAEARQKEAEARQEAIANCKKMKEILEKKENECKTIGCDDNTKSRLAKAWVVYNEQCKNLLIEAKNK